MLQLALAEPLLAIFDEIDSGLDVDALEVVGQAMARFKKNKQSALVVTHYLRILKYLQPDKVIVYLEGDVEVTPRSGAARVTDQTWLGRFFSSAGVGRPCASS